VDSATGSDNTGDGSSARPWQTLAKAWADRKVYDELRAIYTIQLHGVGPYTMPIMMGSYAGDGGFFVLLGDPSVDVTAISGTFTGDVNTTTFIVPTSAGLGVDTHKGKFLYITSGACAGVRSTVLATTDTSITVPLTDWRTTLGAIVAGDTFSIKTPGTVINVPTISTASGQPNSTFINCTGGGAYPNGPSVGDSPTKHWVVGCSFTGAALRMKRSSMIFAGCVFTQPFQNYGSELQIGGISNGFAAGVGADTKTDKLTGYGCATNSQVINGMNATAGIFGLYTSSTGTLSCGTVSQADYMFLNGCRLEGSLFMNTGRVEGNGACLNIFNKTITLQSFATLVINGGTWNFAVTSGECILVKQGSTAVISFGTATGGTTDAASVAMRALSGSKIIMVNKAPTLTGVAGADMKADSTAAIANATLSANGQSTLDAATQAIIMRVAA
jgi:hypothetical protein